MAWIPISEAPRDGTPVVAAKVSSTSIMSFPYPLTSRFLDGKWAADMGDDRWEPYDPQPTHFLRTPGE